jgi:acyl-CoA reductase-like NAD-dependent aldehyde dehydrogenase
MTESGPHTATSLAALLDRQRQAFLADPMPGLAVRLDRLQRLASLLHEHEDEIVAAIDADFAGRPPTETALLEIFPCLEAIRFARRRLARWMRDERRRVSLWFLPGRAEVRWQPLGVVGVMVPWNYPLYLAVGPLTAALAAGNRALVKMPEYTPRFSALFARLVAARFAADELAVVEGDVAVSRAFAALPFDHLLFTGSTAIGRQVMRSAADRLVPVTLELGGKSPVLVAPGFDLARAARRIAHAKLINAGQTCVAPDYVLVPRGAEEAFVDELRRAAGALFGDGRTPDYAAIINDSHKARLQALLEQARAQGARCVPLLGDGTALAGRHLLPHALLDVPLQAAVMQEEILGPLLPVLPYDDVDAALAFINARPRPLALYLFDDDRARIDRCIATTRSGGVTVNDCMLHIAQDDLPFGGIGDSGMGQYHGTEGFRTFSKARPIFRQGRFSGVPLLAPPYGERVRRLLALLLGRR